MAIEFVLFLLITPGPIFLMPFLCARPYPDGLCKTLQGSMRMDLYFILIAVGLAALTFGLGVLCDRLMEKKS